jgi:hypothetical protein
VAGWLHFQYADDCQAANPTYGHTAPYGCKNNWGNIGTTLPADFSQIGYATWSKHCYMRVVASPPPTALLLPPPPPLPPAAPAAPPLAPKAYLYQIVQSNTCASAGGAPISSNLAACTAAGEALSIAWTRNLEYDSPHVPSGCIVSSDGEALYFNPTFSTWPCGRITSLSTWHCVCRFDVQPQPQPPQPPPAPPVPPAPPPTPPLPPLQPLQPGSKYVRSSSEVITALKDSSIDRIVLAAGVYEFTDSSMCFKATSESDEDFIGSALCIDRALTIEAQEAGTVKLDAKGQRRVISIRSAGKATLIGLEITGGYSLEGGGLYVETGGVANLEGCVVRKNHATITGGGLYVNGVARMENCKLNENTAGKNGGGLYVNEGAKVAVTDCRLYENTAATGGGAYNGGALSLTTSLLQRNTGRPGAQLSLAVASELFYILPVPLGHYLDGAMRCEMQTCFVNATCKLGCELKPCDTQFCDYVVDHLKYMKVIRPSSAEAYDGDQFPKACLAGVQGDSDAAQNQSSPFCAGACAAGFYCPLGTSQPLPCAVGRFSRGGAKTAEECLSCSPGSVANATGMKECALCEPGKYQPETGTTVCIACAVASFCPGWGSASATPCPGGTYSNVSGLDGVWQCTGVESGFWAPTRSAFPEECPKSGFTCPGSARDVANEPPGSKPILIGAGQASVDIEEDIIMFGLEFNAAPNAFDLVVAIAKLATHYDVDASLISASLISAEATPLSNRRRLTSNDPTLTAGSRLLLNITICVPEKSEDEATTLRFASHLATFGTPELFGGPSSLTQEITISSRTRQESVDCPKGYCEALLFNYQHQSCLAHCATIPRLWCGRV